MGNKDFLWFWWRVVFLAYFIFQLFFKLFPSPFSMFIMWSQMISLLICAVFPFFAIVLLKLYVFAFPFLVLRHTGNLQWIVFFRKGNKTFSHLPFFWSLKKFFPLQITQSISTNVCQPVVSSAIVCIKSGFQYKLPFKK